MLEHVVIVGAGQAGARTAEALRASGFAGNVSLVGAEVHPPYERPPLSKAVLSGSKPAASTSIFKDHFFSERGIELVTNTTVVDIDAASRLLPLSDGRELNYSHLVICTGGRVREIPLAPPDRPGIFYLRTLADAEMLGATLRGIKNIAIVGAGFLGLEVAATARSLGVNATVIETQPNILARAMVPEVAAHVEAAHRAQNVGFRLATQLLDVTGEYPNFVLNLSVGGSLRAEAIVVAVGMRPNVELAQSAGLEVDDGIVVDEFGRTSDPAIYAAGDVANHFNPFLERRVRLESWQNAQNQAISTAKGIAGTPHPYREIPWFWSDQFDMNIQMLGQPVQTDKVVLRGRPADRRFICFNLRDDRLVGATLFNMGAETRFLRLLMERRETVKPSVLRDGSVQLRDLVRAPAQRA